MNDLISRLEAASGPDREVDLAISVLLQPNSDIARLLPHRRGLDHDPGMSWDIYHSGSVVFQLYTDDGRCTYNGGYPLPTYTASIDAALTLVPEGWEWQVSNRAPKPHEGRAYLNNRQLINTGRGGLTRNPSYCGSECTAATPAIAVCISALRARAALKERSAVTTGKQD